MTADRKLIKRTKNNRVAYVGGGGEKVQYEKQWS